MKRICILISVVCLLCVSGCNFKNTQPTPESVFNAANTAMLKGEDQIAVELYYKLLKDYPTFKRYKPEILSRLGNLLYETEGYEEAEKILQILVSKYPQYKDIDKAYEELLYIYVEENKDKTKAKIVRNAYARKIGNSAALTDIDRTIALMTDGKMTEVLSLDASVICITGRRSSSVFDTDVFPVKNYIKKEAVDYSGETTVIRMKQKGAYGLFIKKGKTTAVRIKNSKNGYAPQWSWDGKLFVFTAMNWETNERSVKVCNLEKGLYAESIFSGKNVEPITSISADASKIIFVYAGKPWIINCNGTNRTLLDKKIKIKNFEFIAWSKTGDKIVFFEETAPEYIVYSLGENKYE
ncbi:MAG: hypothetical protein WCJ46_00490 [bacterium]